MQNLIEEILKTPEIWSKTIELDRNEFLIKAGEKDQKQNQLFQRFTGR